MVQNQAELDNIILESQDFPEVNVQKGASCFSEEFAYLVKSIFSGVKKDVRFFYESFREKGVPLERFSLYNIDKSQIILGEQAGGILVPAHVSTTYVKIKPAREIEFHIINKDSGIVPIRIEVYDKDFLESAKVFAKAYTKWCGQEATVTKEYVETEEKAQEMVRLENMIEESKKTGKGNINELEDIPETTFERPERIRQGEIIFPFYELIDKAVKKCHKDRAYSLENSRWDNEYTKRNYRVYKKTGNFLLPGHKYAGSISVKIFPNFSAPKETKLEITTNINSKCEADYLLAMSNKLKQELNAPVKIIQNY